MLRYFAQAYGITEHDLKHFAGGHEWSDGTVYEYIKDSKTYLLKMLHPSEKDKHAYARTSERMQYLYYLGNNGVLIVNPIPSEDGSLIVQAESDGKKAIAYAWQKIEGKHFEGRTEAELKSFYFSWGKTIGSIHRLAKLYPDWQHSRSLDVAGNPLISRKAEYDVFYNWLQDEEVKQVWADVYGQMNRLPVNRDNFGFIHNDLHAGNLLINETGVYALDFDVANFQPFIMDIAIAFYSEFNRIRQYKLQDVFTDYHNAVMDNIMLGYNTENQLAKEEFDALDLFFAYRRMIMFCVFYNEVKAKAPDYLETMKKRIVDRESVLNQKGF